MTISELQKSIDSLPFEVPDGTLIRPRSGGYYVSDHPALPGVWAKLRTEHARSGLWPVFLQCHEEAPVGSWAEGAVGFRWSYYLSPDPNTYDAAAVLEKHWRDFQPPPGSSPGEMAEYAMQTAPFGPVWPGPAPGIEPRIPPDEVADDFAERLANDQFTRLGLVLADRGADIPRSTEWYAGEQISPGEVSAILRSWEDRFGVRLIRIGFNTMVLSVAAPPTTLAAAQRVAAEHLAFCPENIGYGNGALSRYAEELIGVHHWSFWWDRDPAGWFDFDGDGCSDGD